MNQTLQTTSQLSERAPRCAAWFPVNLMGLAAAALVLWLLRDNASYTGVIKGCFAAIATFLTIGSFELWVGHVNRRASTGIADGAIRSLSLRRVAMRLSALATIYLALAFCYWSFDEYRGSDFYQPWYQALQVFGPWVLGCTLLYFMWMDTHQRDSDDAYMQLATLLWKHERPANWRPLRELVAGWMVKGYFLPLMTVYFGGQITEILRLYNGLHVDQLAIFTFFYNLGFTIDLLFAIVGYTCTLRLFDSHIRSVEPTAFGCVIALICYQPFFSVLDRGYLHYSGTALWDAIFAGWPTFRIAWGVVILLLGMGYCLSTAAFGLRFSNLTHRGIITSGPYRFTKHPAYITKCLSYWMISVPFLDPTGWQTIVRHCFALSLICVIYFLRARTEERHLMRDPDYRAYAAWMDQHGLFARARRLFN